MTGIDPKKYMVIKNPDSVDARDAALTLDPDTYFVLRNGDLASLAALRGYAQGLLLIMDVHGDQMSDEEREHIDELFNDVSGLADRWERGSSRHLPT